MLGIRCQSEIGAGSVIEKDSLKIPVHVMKKKVVTARKDIYNRCKFIERGTV